MGRMWMTIGIMILTSVATRAESPEPPSPKLGMNVTGVSYWANDWPFVDLVRCASDWRIETEADAWGRLYDHPLYAAGKLRLTETGYPVPAAGGFQSGDLGVRSLRILVPGGNEAVAEPGSRRYFEIPTGVYTLMARGTGRLHLRGGGFEETELTLNGDPVRVPVVRRPGADEGVDRFGLITIRATSADDPVRDIHLVMPGFEKTFRDQPSHPLFLERLRPFDGVRLMDWNAVNRSPLRHWHERTTPDWYSWSAMAKAVRTDAPAFATRRGLLPDWRDEEPEVVRLGSVPLEVQVQLANELQADLWVCVPPLADEQYVHRMATLLHQRLDPGQELIFEYANEVYNRAFLVNRLARQLGPRQYPDLSEQAAADRWLAERQARTCEQVNRAIGRPDDAALATHADAVGRVRLVLPYQIADAYLAMENVPRVDAIIANFYWGIPFVKQMAENDWQDREQRFLLERMDETVFANLRQKLGKVRDHAAALSARHYPLQTWTYEGGSHFHDIWWRRDIREKTDAVTRRLAHHPRMAEFYRRMFRTLYETGFDDANYLFASTGGGFGHLQHPTQDPLAAPKYRAAVDEARSNGGGQHDAP